MSKIVNLESLLQEVNLRDFWKHESINFTQWLAEPGNLQELSDLLDLDLSLVEKEARSGSFRVDILARDDITGNLVIIENQLENSNHDHLGKCLTYLSHHEAKYCIWICKELRPEHKAAIDFLNRETPSDYRFYAVEIHAYLVGANNQKVYHYDVIAQPDYLEKYKAETMNNDKITALNNFWESVKGKLDGVLQKRCHIMYSGKRYMDIVFDDQPFWMSISFTSPQRDKLAKVSIITKEADTGDKIRNYITSTGVDKELDIKESNGKKNNNWRLFTVSKKYEEDPKDYIDWMTETAKIVYDKFKNFK